MELRESHLRYMLAIDELRSARNTGVATVEIARLLRCSKSSVTGMVSNLMEMGLLIREHYGKIYLTEEGLLLTEQLACCVAAIRERLPALGVKLPEKKERKLAAILTINLPEDCRAALADQYARETRCPAAVHDPARPEKNEKRA